jgi:Zn-dependent protease
MELQQGLILYLILVGSLSVHEWAHAYVADKLGDNTPRSQGRITLNPMAHIDPIGTVLIPLFMIFMSPGFAIFGWGKPVMVNPRNFARWKRDDILVSMAGPASNLVICLIVAIIGGIAMRFVPNISALVVQVLLINSILIIFNLLPIPPLDGSHVMKHLVGMSEETYARIAMWGILILLVVINFPPTIAIIRSGMSILLGIFYSLALVFAGAG